LREQVDRQLGEFMTAASETPDLESRVGHYYQMDGTYLVGREKVREYARAVQDYHPAHWDVGAAAKLGYSELVAPLTFTSTPGMSCNRLMFESVVVGYDTYVQTRKEKESAQMGKFEKEQEQVADIKSFVARFGHGTKKMAQQAQSREKLLKKMEEAGLTERVEVEVVKRLRFPDCGKLPPPVLQVQNVTFGYPGGPLLYEKLDFGVDLDSRIALVGPNGAGKTTLLKLLATLRSGSGPLRLRATLRLEARRGGGRRRCRL
jgi:ABC-type multidrug transport system fused ATPase/permease subunit